MSVPTAPFRQCALHCGLLVALLFASGHASATGDAEKVIFAQLIPVAGPQHGAVAIGSAHTPFIPRPSALGRLGWEVSKRTSIDVTNAGVAVGLHDEETLRRYPFLYLAASTEFSPDDADVGRLRRHLVAGGVLVVDAADAQPGGPFDTSVRALARRLFPKEALTRLPGDHVLFRSFYLLRAPLGRLATVPYVEGVEHDGRLVMIYIQNDLGGAWARDDYGQWEFEVLPGGDQQREMAFRWGVNLVMYALCLDYKSDQVHVPFIMRRRTWQTE